VNEHIVQVGAKVSMVGGAGGAGVGAFTLNEYLAIGGFAIAVIGFLVNFYYAWKDDRRKELESKIRLREMEL
jgi:Bacteriophage holin family, superfamily II-like